MVNKRRSPRWAIFFRGGDGLGVGWAAQMNGWPVSDVGVALDGRVRT